jgi:hypothetical protein
VPRRLDSFLTDTEVAQAFATALEIVSAKKKKF